MNKYEKWYNNIIKRARDRILTGYSEKHHIVPRSLGGSDDPSNLVNLSAKEHFICHWLLVKMHTGTNRGKMINALYIMQGKSTHQKRYHTKITSRIYDKLRNEYSQYISNLNKGRKQPPEEKLKQIKAMTGKKRAPFSEEWRAKLSAASKGENNSRYGAIVSAETRKKIGDKIRGRKHSEEEKRRRADAVRGTKREKILCPHCQQMISVNTYPRWHGDNCRSKGL